MKLFLLIAGTEMYPEGDIENWVSCFTTHEEAEAAKIENPADWHEIVDLKEWIFPEVDTTNSGIS